MPDPNGDEENVAALVRLDASIAEIKRNLDLAMKEREHLMRKIKRPPPERQNDSGEPPPKKMKNILKDPVLIVNRHEETPLQTKPPPNGMEPENAATTEAEENEKRKNVIPSSQTKIPEIGMETEIGSTAEGDEKDEDTWTHVEPKMKGRNYIPPIFAYDVGNWTLMSKTIKELCRNTFTAKNGPEYIKLKFTSEEDYRCITRYFEAEKVQFHTFSIEKTKFFKVVLKNLPPSIKEEEIKSELHELGFDEVIYVAQLKDKLKKPASTYQLTLKKSENSREIFNLRSLFHCHVRVESYKKSKLITQCHRCQRFGHTLAHCQAEFKCVKCAGSHDTRECMKDSKTKAKCANCGGPHPASYKGCDFFKMMQQNKEQGKENNQKKSIKKQEKKQEEKETPRIASYASYANVTRRSSETLPENASKQTKNMVVNNAALIESLQNNKTNEVDLFELLKIICQQFIRNGNTP